MCFSLISEFLESTNKACVKNCLLILDVLEMKLLIISSNPGQQFIMDGTSSLIWKINSEFLKNRKTSEFFSYIRLQESQSLYDHENVFFPGLFVLRLNNVMFIR